MTKQKEEVIVGVVVIAVLVALLLIALLVSGVSLFRSGYYLYVDYDYIQGVVTGSTVKYAGVKAGEIKGTEVIYSEGQRKPQIRLKIFLDDWVEVREHSAIHVRGSTPLSEPHLEIISQGKGF